MGEEEKLDEIKQILQDACDRDWEDESLFATASIAANGLYWRGKEIERQRKQIQALREALNSAVAALAIQQIHDRNDPARVEALGLLVGKGRSALAITDSECR